MIIIIFLFILSMSNTEYHDIMAHDQFREDNKWVGGYDDSPEVLARMKELQGKENKRFQAVLESLQVRSDK